MIAHKLDSDLNIESFDGFAIVHLPERATDDQRIEICIRSLYHLAERDMPLIFVDLGHSRQLDAQYLTKLGQEIASFKSKRAVEITILCEPALSQQLEGSILAESVQLYERRENQDRFRATEELLSHNLNHLCAELEGCLDGAINDALQRWIGQRPTKMELTWVSINPSTDIASFVSMTMDGYAFRVFLSSARTTLRDMLIPILKSKIELSDSVVTDGACELLNYLTAFFKQHLSHDGSDVETNAPQFLRPDEMLAVLDKDQKVHLVQTPYGSFNVWLEIAD